VGLRLRSEDRIGNLYQDPDDLSLPRTKDSHLEIFGANG